MLTLTLTNPNPNLHQWEMQAQVGTLAKSESKESTEFPKFRRVPPSNKTVKFTSTNSFQDYQEPGLDPSIGSGNHPHGQGHDVTTRIESTHGSNTPPLAEGERQAFVNRGDSTETVMEEGSAGHNNNKSFFSTNIIGYGLTYLNIPPQNPYQHSTSKPLSTHALTAHPRHLPCSSLLIFADPSTIVLYFLPVHREASSVVLTTAIKNNEINKSYGINEINGPMPEDCPPLLFRVGCPVLLSLRRLMRMIRRYGCYWWSQTTGRGR